MTQSKPIPPSFRVTGKVNLLSALLVTLWLVAPAAATPQDAETDVVQDTTKRVAQSWSVLPIVFTSPDTDWAFGILPQVVFQLPNTERPSRAFVAAYYTLNKQYAITSLGSLWFNQDRDNLEVALERRYWPTDFFGLSAPDADVEGIPYVENLWNASILGSRRVHSQLRVGFIGRLTRMRIEGQDGDDQAALGPVNGSQGGWIAGLGPTIGIDSRDNVFYPTRGWLVNIGMPVTGYAFGGDYDYVTFGADFRTYRAVAKNQVLAAQVVMVFNSADVPFWSMDGVGTVVRGYTTAQFLDRQMAALQLEYRFVPIYWRIGLAVFAGVGTVADHIDELPSGQLRWAAGLGIRVAFLRDAKINVRWDFGFGPGSSGDYLEMGEAF